MPDHTLMRAAGGLHLKAGLLADICAEVQELAEKVQSLAEAAAAAPEPEPTPASPIDMRYEELIAGLRTLDPARARAVMDSVLRDIDIPDELVTTARRVRDELAGGGQRPPTQNAVIAKLRERGYEFGHHKAGVLWDKLKAEPASANGNGQLV